MTEFVFTVAEKGDVCMLAGVGTYTIERSNGSVFQPLRLNSKLVRIGSSNQCVHLDFPGLYRIEWATSASCACAVEIGIAPMFTYTEHTHCVTSGGATGATGATGPKGCKGDTGAAGKDGINGKDGAKGDKGDPGIIDTNNPVAVSELMAAMSANPDAITITDAFGSPIFVGLPT